MDKFSKIVFPMKLREDMFSNQNEDPERGEGLRTRERGPQREVKGCSRPCMVCTQLFCFTSCHFLLAPPPAPLLSQLWRLAMVFSLLEIYFSSA